MHVCMYVILCMHVCMFVCMRARARVCVCVCVCVCVFCMHACLAGIDMPDLLQIRRQLKADLTALEAERDKLVQEAKSLQAQVYSDGHFPSSSTLLSMPD